MKKVIFMVVALFCSATYAQDKAFNFGIKAGLNYGDNGKIELEDLTNSGSNILREKADDRTGYHFGVFLRANITDNFYIKPEFQYTLNSSRYAIDGRNLEYDIKKLDLPVLAGISVLGPVHVFGGPAFQYIVENDLQDVRLGDVKNEFTLGLQFGVGVQIGRLNADVRYERGLSDNQAQAIDDNFNQRVRVDSRPNQFILSVGLDL